MVTDSEFIIMDGWKRTNKQYLNDVNFLTGEVHRLVAIIDNRDNIIERLESKIKISKIGMDALCAKVNVLISFMRELHPDHRLFDKTKEKSPFGLELNELDVFYKNQIIRMFNENNIPLSKINEIWFGHSKE